MHPVLRLYEDVLSTAESIEFQLPPLPRFIFVVHGSATIGGNAVNEGTAWQGEGATLVRPGPGGVTCWRCGAAPASPTRPADRSPSGSNGRRRRPAGRSTPATSSPRKIPTPQPQLC